MQQQTFTPEKEPERHPKTKFSFLYIAAIIMLLISLYLIFSSNSNNNGKGPKGESTEPIGPSPVDMLLLNQLPDVLTEKGLSDITLDEIHFNSDHTQAMLWMATTDPETGEVIAREPSTILAIWDKTKQQWNLTFEKDPKFLEDLAASDFKESELSAHFLEYDPHAVTSGVTYGGYYLPWQAGLTKRLTWSVGHTSCADSYCLHAFDFADGTMFQITAAKAGYVYHFKDTCSNGNSSCTNSITIQDRTTTPYTYDIYLHIAKGSVPASIRQIGKYVAQGQPIATVDDTGYSTGNHVHFMVVEQTTLNSCATYCWGKSVDITFRDVDINWDPVTKGGRPRLSNEASWYGGQGRTNYTSGNVYRPFSFIYILFPIYK